jgi:hypothetical protein
MEDRMGTRRLRFGRFGLIACLVVAASLALGACGGTDATPGITYITPAPSPTPEATPTLEETPTPTDEPTPTASPLPTPIISSVTVTSTAPDGRWKVTFEKPIVSGIPAPAATAMNNSITAKVNAYINAFTSSGLPPLGPTDPQNTLDGSFTVAYNSPTLVSLRFMVSEYTGGAHPGDTPGSINFKVSSGAQINLPDLFTSQPSALALLSLQSRLLLAAELGAEADPGWINTGTTAVLTNFNHAWVFTTGGLELTFDEYQVGPYATGMPTITIPWGTLATEIKPSGPAAEFIP